MASQRLLFVAFVALILLPNTWARSGKEYKFRGGMDGANPQGGLATDGAGNFYGTTIDGGRSSLGTVFKLSRDQGGHWTEAVIYNFAGGADGELPQGNLVIDAGGNLYGTASGGIRMWGIVFELTPGPNGSWTETTLYNFQNGLDGRYPVSGVIFDVGGSLYGTASSGGVCNTYCGGTAFKLTPIQGGGWTETTLYNFLAGTDGWNPSGLVLDTLGNLYGATARGGNIQGGQCGDQGCGTVFQLTPSQSGSWTKSTLYTFNLSLDGGYPSSGVIFDNSGNLYGETYYGGSFACPGIGCGVIYELTPGLVDWKFSVAHTFNGLNGSKGQGPSGGLAVDKAGSLYGTTGSGGTAKCFGLDYACGTVFKLIPGSSGVFSILASFDGTNGGAPTAGVIVDADGNLYGTAVQGGNLNCGQTYGCGVVFTLTP